MERTFSAAVDDPMNDGGTDGGGEGTRRWRDAVRPGVIGSLVLHAAVLGLLLYQVGVPPVQLPVIPVEMVQLAEQTATPSPQPNAPVQPGAGSAPQVASVAPPRPAPRAQPRPAPVPPVAPPSTPQPAPDALPPAPQDALQSQLDALAKLRVPNNAGAGSAASGSGPVGAAGYRVEDLIRAQVQRRWNLRLDELGERELIVTIHVVLEPDGTVAKAEIVDTPRTRGDDVYRSIAISARNAVLLSSPLTLPSGMTEEMRDMTISFNTRDSLR
jgi:outer membrane biosynthesis protein TonB